LIRRLYLLLTTAVVAAAVMSLSGAALADPPVDSGNPSCFGAFARSQPGAPGPGGSVSEGATTLAGTGKPESGTDEVATNIGPVQHVREGVCPSNTPFELIE
jgi:hypothetical protein